MEMKYTVNPDFTISDIEFTGLTGNEHVFSVKESLIYLTVTNPGIAFAEGVKNGTTNELDDEKYAELLSTIRCVTDLFRYGDEDKSLRELNVLMLLRNAITALVQKDVALRKYQKAKTTKIKTGGIKK